MCNEDIQSKIGVGATLGGASKTASRFGSSEVDFPFFSCASSPLSSFGILLAGVSKLVRWCQCRRGRAV